MHIFKEKLYIFIVKCTTQQIRTFFEIVYTSTIHKLFIFVLKILERRGGGGKNYPVRSSTSGKYHYFLY